ncbi:dynamin-2A-like isoform X1 [Carex littledalei]|uniref:dynamin GTPase n=1 Tax=Carex littledalei TaxID=544730 RepID=A0A833R349_9POAL|nr:dynamin-2A-like isoform X1 [Carex littledalei]
MEAIEELSQLSESMLQASALLADEDVDDPSTKKRNSTFLNVVALGNVGAGKSAALNSLIGHPVLPTGENGATRAPICIDLQRDSSLSSRAIVLLIDNKSQQVSASALRHSLQDRLSKASGTSRGRSDEIPLKIRTSTAPPLKLIDLPGLDQRAMDESVFGEYAARNDAILLVIIAASQAPEVASSKALRTAKELDPEGTRTIGVISKIDQASGEPKSLAAVQALLSGQGPRSAADMPWVALIGQSVSLASAQAGSVGSDNSLETAWRAETESLKSILTGAPQSKLGRVALVETLAKQIRNRMKVRLPNILNGLQGKTQMVQDELVRLGEQMVDSSEGTRAIALELCREFEDKFLAHIALGEGAGWKIVASFEGNFPKRIKQIPLDRHFEINNVKRIVLEADGYQPYLISPEKGLRSLIKGVLELAKEPSRLCVEEVHRVLIDIVSAAANATSGLSRYPPFKREIIALATSALDKFKIEATKMVVALVDMERAFVPPQHFIRLLQRRMERQRREEEIKTKSTSNRAPSPQAGDGSSKSAKDKEKDKEKDKSTKEKSNLQVAGNSGEITAGYFLKKKTKTNGWSRRWFVLNEKNGKLGYTISREETHFRAVITLEDCIIEDVDENEAPMKDSKKESKKDKDKSNGPKANTLAFKLALAHHTQYKTILKTHSSIVIKAESMADKIEMTEKIRNIIESRGGGPSKGPDGGKMSFSDSALDTMARRPADPEEELRWMSQEVRGYVEAVLNSLAANVPKVYTSQSNDKIEQLIQEDQNVKRRRERYQKQSSLLSKLTRQLSVHDNRASLADSNWSNGPTASETSPRTLGRSHSGGADDWRSAFDAAANGPTDFSRSSGESRSRSASSGRSRRPNDSSQNGDLSMSSRRTPNRMPPPPPPRY